MLHGQPAAIVVVPDALDLLIVTDKSLEQGPNKFFKRCRGGWGHGRNTGVVVAALRRSRLLGRPAWLQASASNAGDWKKLPSSASSPQAGNAHAKGN
jgi:hypothetical protein